jgi:hypothetical protein
MERHRHRLPFNLCDPITKEPLRSAAAINLQADAKHRVLYDAPTLANALWGCGKMQDPLTRRELNTVELLRLDHRVAAAHRVCPSLYLERKEPALFESFREDAELLLDLDGELAEVQAHLDRSVLGHATCRCRRLRQEVVQSAQEALGVLYTMLTVDIDHAVGAFRDFYNHFATWPPELLAELHGVFRQFTV